MTNNEITNGWIAQQRAVCGNVKRLNLFSLAEADKIFKVDMPAALDALEASMQREAEKDAEISRLNIELSRPESYYLLNKIIDLTAERDAEKRRADAALTDLRILAINGQDCVTCKHGKKNLNDCGTYDGPCEWEWRGPTAANTGAPAGAESEPIKDVNMKGISIHNCGDVKSQKIISIKTMDDNIDL